MKFLLLIEDVVRRVGVLKVIVLRVINGIVNVFEKKKKVVLDVIKVLNYILNVIVKNLVWRKIDIIGIII